MRGRGGEGETGGRGGGDGERGRRGYILLSLSPLVPLSPSPLVPQSLSPPVPPSPRLPVPPSPLSPSPRLPLPSLPLPPSLSWKGAGRFCNQREKKSACARGAFVLPQGHAPWWFLDAPMALDGKLDEPVLACSRAASRSGIQCPSTGPTYS